MPIDIDISKITLKKKEIEFLEEVKSLSGILEKKDPFPSALNKIVIFPKTVLSHPDLYTFFKSEVDSKTIKDFVQGFIAAGKKEDLFLIKRKLREDRVENNEEIDSDKALTRLLIDKGKAGRILLDDERVFKLNVEKVKKLKALIDRDNKKLVNERSTLQEKLGDLQGRIEKNDLTLEKRRRESESLNREYHIVLSEYQTVKGEYKEKVLEFDEKLEEIKKDLSTKDESVNSIQTVYSQGKKVYVDTNFQPLDHEFVESKLGRFNRLERMSQEIHEEKKRWHEKVRRKKRRLEDIKSRLITSQKMIEYFEHVNENCKRTEERLAKEIRNPEQERGENPNQAETINDIVSSYESLKRFFEEATVELASDVDFIEGKTKPFLEAVRGLGQLQETEETYKENLKRINKRINELKSSLDKNNQKIKEFIDRKRDLYGQKFLWDEKHEKSSLVQEYSALESLQSKLLSELKTTSEERKQLISERKEYFEGINEEIRKNQDEIEKAKRALIDVVFRLSSNYCLLCLSSIHPEVFSNPFLFLFLKTASLRRSLKEIEDIKYDYKELLSKLRPRHLEELESINIASYEKDYHDLLGECSGLSGPVSYGKDKHESVSKSDAEENRFASQEKHGDKIEGLNEEVGKLREELSYLSTQNRLFLEELGTIKDINYPALARKKEEKKKSDLSIQQNIDLLTEKLSEITKDDIFNIITGKAKGDSRKRFEDVYGFTRNLIGELFMENGHSLDASGLKETIETKTFSIKELFHTLEKREESLLQSKQEKEILDKKMGGLAEKLADNLLQNRQVENKFLEEIEKKDKKIEELNEKIEKLSLQLLQHEGTDRSDPGKEKKENILFFRKRGMDKENAEAGAGRMQSASVKKAISTLILFSGVVYHLINQASNAKIGENKVPDYLMTSNIPQVEVVADQKNDRADMYSNLLSENPGEQSFPLIKDELYMAEFKRIVRVRDFVYQHEKANDAEFVTEAVMKQIHGISGSYGMSTKEFISFMNGVRDTSLPLSMSLLKETKEDIGFLSKEYKDFIEDLSGETDRISSLTLVYRLNKIIELNEKSFFKRIYNEFVDLGIPKKVALANVIHNERNLKERKRYFTKKYKTLYKGTIRPIKTLEEMDMDEFKQVAIPYIEGRYRIFANHKGFRIPRRLDQYVESMAENIYISAKRFNIPVTSLMTIAHQETFYLNILGDNKKSASPFQIYRPTKFMILQNMRRDGFRIPKDVKRLEDHLSLASYMAAYHFAELMELYSVELDIKGSKEEMKKIVYDLNRSTTSYNGGRNYHKRVFLKQLELNRFLERKLQKKALS